MGRGKKERLVCECLVCGARHEHRLSGVMELSLDELESIRLVDLEECDQQEAADRMAVSRGTIQRLLANAHRKVAFALLHGLQLGVSVEGLGSAVQARACAVHERPCRYCCAQAQKQRQLRSVTMKVAVTCDENGKVFQHFGHTPAFALFEVVNGAIASEERVETNGTGHGALADFLAERGVERLFCGGIGGGAQAALAEKGIQISGGAAGDARQVVERWLDGSLLLNPNFQCHHHDGDGHHSCASKGCGGHHHHHDHDDDGHHHHHDHDDEGRHHGEERHHVMMGGTAAPTATATPTDPNSFRCGHEIGLSCPECRATGHVCIHQR